VSGRSPEEEKDEGSSNVAAEEPNSQNAGGGNETKGGSGYVVEAFGGKRDGGENSLSVYTVTKRLKHLQRVTGASSYYIKSTTDRRKGGMMGKRPARGGKGRMNDCKKFAKGTGRTSNLEWKKTACTLEKGGTDWV